MYKMIEEKTWERAMHCAVFRNSIEPQFCVTFTHISHTNSGKRDNAAPLFDWEKYYEKNGRSMMPISVQAYHSFVDGIHIGQFVNRLQEYFDITD